MVVLDRDRGAGGLFDRPRRTGDIPSRRYAQMKYWPLLLLFAVGCGGSSPTAPTPRIPDVAGNYAGTLTFVYPQIDRTVVCPASTTIQQTGGALSVAPILLSGPCGNVSFPVGDLDIDANGSIGTETNTIFEPTCGTYQYTASGGFFGREFRFSAIYSSSTCLGFTVTATLTR